jgi:hypothetical protein
MMVVNYKELIAAFTKRNLATSNSTSEFGHEQTQVSI